MSKPDLSPKFYVIFNCLLQYLTHITYKTELLVLQTPNPAPVVTASQLMPTTLFQLLRPKYFLSSLIPFLLSLPRPSEQ